MNRDEFLRTLREALSGEIPPNIIEENIRYYDAYIADEVRKGRTEEEVIEELGGARVIAKTIMAGERLRGRRFRQAVVLRRVRFRKCWRL